MSPIFRKSLCLAMFIALGGAASNTILAGALTYDGQLEDAGQPANGRYDVQLTAWAAPEGGSVLFPTINFAAVEVSGGRFRLEFDAPLGVQEQAWLELAVRDAGSSSAHSVVGSRVKAVNAPLIGQCWSVTGDVGSNPATNFLGTTDAQPLVLRSNNVTGFRLLPAVSNVVSVVGGAAANSVGPTVVGGFIGGGGSPLATENNQVFDDFGTLAGGRGNIVGVSDALNQSFATVGGGLNNRATGFGSTVAGGSDQVSSGLRSTLGGGSFNIASGSTATVAGGNANNAGGNISMIGGGFANLASGNLSSIGGGNRNIAAGGASYVGGGDSSAAIAPLSTVGGGFDNCAGANASWAGGSQAKVRPGAVFTSTTNEACNDVPASGTATGDSGSFVWADGQGSDFTTTGPNQLLARANGGVGINTADIPVHAAMVLANRTTTVNTDLFLRSNGFTNGINISMVPGNLATGAGLFVAQFNGSNFTDRLVIYPNGNFEVNAPVASKPGGGPWATSSDARLKSDITPLDGALDRLLKLSGVSFRYTHPDPMRPAGNHVGFIAQEVAKVFPDWVAPDAQGYLTVGPQGFEALTVEALRELQAEKDVEIAALKADNQDLRTRLERIEQALNLRAAGAGR